MRTVFKYNANCCSGAVVIYGCFNRAREFALRLIEQDIKFDFFCFVSNKNYSLPYLMNKKVLNLQELKKLDNYVIVAPWIETECAYKKLKKFGLENKLRNIEEIHPDLINTSNLIIYGTGGRAKRLFNDFGEYLDVKSFCDSDKAKTVRPFKDKPVLHISELSQVSADTCVIIGSTFYSEINYKLLQYGIKETQIYYLEYNLTSFLNERYNFTYRPPHLTDIICDCKNKNVILYGEKNEVRIMAKKFSFFNIGVEKLERNGFEEDGTIYSLAYHDKADTVCIILDKYSETALDAFVNIGLKKLQYVWLEGYTSHFMDYSKPLSSCVLDPHLGYSYKANNGEEYNGFVKYEYISGEGKPIVIVTLGGSTTVGYQIRQKSWPECLSELLTIKRIEHIIYNGGCHGYNASQELVKLARDGIWIKPDCVISYSGVNNMGTDSDNDFDFKTPFVHYYQRKFYENVINHAKMSTPYGPKMKMKNVNYGVEMNCDKFEFWLTQLKMMHAICNSLGIEYKAFLQPTLYNKMNIKELDRDIAVLDGFLCLDGSLEAVETTGRSKILQTNAWKFRHSAQNINDSWFHDLSDLFDDCDGIYMDECHVYEEGNRMIAQKVYEAIMSDTNETEEGENLCTY